MPGIANYAQHYSEKHPGEEVKIFFMPSSVTCVFHYVNRYDMMYGEHFYNLTWNNGIRHEQMLSDIKVPCIYLHAKEEVADNGVYLCAASREQAERAVALIGNHCSLIETENSSHNIHGTHTQIYVDAINSFLEEGIKSIVSGCSTIIAFFILTIAFLFMFILIESKAICIYLFLFI